MTTIETTAAQAPAAPEPPGGQTPERQREMTGQANTARPETGTAAAPKIGEPAPAIPEKPTARGKPKPEPAAKTATTKAAKPAPAARPAKPGAKGKVTAATPAVKDEPKAANLTREKKATVKERIWALIDRPQGVSEPEVCEALGWQRAGATIGRAVKAAPWPVRKERGDDGRMRYYRARGKK